MHSSDTPGCKQKSYQARSYRKPRDMMDELRDSPHARDQPLHELLFRRGLSSSLKRARIHCPRQQGSSHGTGQKSLSRRNIKRTLTVPSSSHQTSRARTAEGLVDVEMIRMNKEVDHSGPYMASRPE